jgi:CMP/dCMP kinase
VIEPKFGVVSQVTSSSNLAIIDSRRKMAKARTFFVVTIDGPAGAGKTTIAKNLAQRLGFCMLDSGALYRALALALLREGVRPEDQFIHDGLLESIRISVEPDIGGMRIMLEGEDMSSHIRSEDVGNAASRFSAKPEVRRALLDIQRGVAEKCDIVAEGRDMGAVVFPFAQAKFFLTADPEERAKRRYSELTGKGQKPFYAQVLSDMIARDRRDESRDLAPMIPADDATIIDTTTLTPRDVTERILQRIGVITGTDIRLT